MIMKFIKYFTVKPIQKPDVIKEELVNVINKYHKTNPNRDKWLNYLEQK